MSTSTSSSTSVKARSSQSSLENEDDSFVDTTSSMPDADLEGNDTSSDDNTSIPVAVKRNANIEANAKPACPSTVNHIINALSAVGTFGGLALITTGGMGTTLNKPIDNNIANVAMVLGGGALLLGSLIGNVIYTNNQAA